MIKPSQPRTSPSAATRTLGRGLLAHQSGGIVRHTPVEVMSVAYESGMSRSVLGARLGTSGEATRQKYPEERPDRDDSAGSSVPAAVRR